jgi:glycosyltransferase involved in cell wall biosynthesis
VDTTRVAIVHERFTVRAGSERVVEQLHRLFPEAPIFVPFCDRATLLPGLADADIRTGALQRLFRGRDRHAHLLPLLPTWFSRLDLDEYEIVVTSHHAFANRVRPRRARVVSYTHTPARWMWDGAMRAHEVGGRAGRAALAAFAATQRRPDRRAARRLAAAVANSGEVARRMRAWWGVEATVVFPPVDTDRFVPDPTVRRDDFFLYAGRLVPYKRPEVAVAAARAAGVRLVVAGEGRVADRVAAAAGPGIEMLGAVDDATLLDLLRRCRALVQPGVEDFGILAVEAQACGTPVITPDAGGARDTVVDDETGIRYETTTGDEVAPLERALRHFDGREYDPARIRAHAERFAASRFRAEMAAVVDAVVPPS